MKIQFLFHCLLFSVSLAWGQAKKDVIVKRSGEKIECQIRQITPAEVFYGDSAMPLNAFRSIPIADVAVVLYGDGRVQTFKEAAPQANPATAQPVPAPPPAGQAAAPASNFATPGQDMAPPPPPAKTTGELYQMGYGDSQLYYHLYGGARAGTAVATVLAGPIFGLIPAIACSSTTPSRANLTPPPGPYVNDPSYVQGYKDGAKRKKSRKVWNGYGLGTGILFGLLIVLSIH